MSLQIECEAIPQNKNLIFFSEITPNYNAVTETGGWGTPNPARSDIYTADPVVSPAALITVTEPDGTETTVDVISSVPPLYIIGNDSVYNPIAITQQFLGKATGTTFSDGLMYIELNVQGLYGPDPQASFTSQDVVQLFFIENVRCCVSNMLLASETCNCGKTSKKSAMEAYVMFGALEAAIACTNPQWSKANCILETLQAICARYNSGCGGCSGGC